MMNSPRKKAKTPETSTVLKREGNENESAPKRPKVEKESDIHTMKRKNFIAACEQVSYAAYYDFKTRLQLIYLPSCIDGKKRCRHHEDNQVYVREMPNHAEEAVKIELKTNMWQEALEVCQLSVTHEQYLSAAILKEIIEIMMNAHEDEFVGYTAEDLLEQSHQILTLNFSTHPPCNSRLRNLYKTFLTSPMDLKEKTFTNRSQFECDKGIVKYCINRLEYEISTESKDEALIDKHENIPEDMRQGVKGVYWQKEKFEIFEVLERPERIERLMAVLKAIVELLQFDLVLWHSRYTNNLGNHMMRSHKPLMAYVLWSNVLYTGGVNKICRQILRLFARLVHLQYPEEHIKTMTTWVNTIIQTFYICETNSNSDYPNTGRYCMAFAKEFYRIIADLPHDSIIKILNTIQPSFMANLMGTLHTQALLRIQEDNILKIFLNFVKKEQWKEFPQNDIEIEIPKKAVMKPKKVKDMLRYILKACDEMTLFDSMDFMEDYNVYSKFDLNLLDADTDMTENEIMSVLYITMEAFLESHSVQLVQDTIENLNEQILANCDNSSGNCIPENCSYSVTEHFIKRYRTIFQVSKELVTELYKRKSDNKLPASVLKIAITLGFIE